MFTVAIRSGTSPIRKSDYMTIIATRNEIKIDSVAYEVVADEVILEVGLREEGVFEDEGVFGEEGLPFDPGVLPFDPGVLPLVGD